MTVEERCSSPSSSEKSGNESDRQVSPGDQVQRKASPKHIPDVFEARGQAITRSNSSEAEGIMASPKELVKNKRSTRS